MTAQETIWFCLVMGIAIASLVGFIYMQVQIAKDEEILKDPTLHDPWLE